MAVVMIVRAAPDAARGQGEKAEYPHEHLRRARVGEDGVVLLIMIDDEHPKQEQPAEDAADGLACEVEIPMGAGERRQQQGGG